MNRLFVLSAMGAALLSTTAMAPSAMAQVTGPTPPLSAQARGVPITDTPVGGRIVVLGEDNATRLKGEREWEMRHQGFAGSSADPSVQQNTYGGSAYGAPVAAIGGAAEFVNKAGHSGAYEVESSRLALDHSSNRTVRQFAQRMIDDHGRANQTLAALSRTQGVEAPAMPDLAQQQRIAELRGLRGTEFDRTYVGQQLTAHREAVDLFQTVARSDRADLQPYRGFAQQTLPTLQHHLRDVEAIAAGSPVASAR